MLVSWELLQDMTANSKARVKSLKCCCLLPQRGGGICGPWIPDDGEIVTHTVSKAGKMNQLLWTSKVTKKLLCQEKELMSKSSYTK